MVSSKPFMGLVRLASRCESALAAETFLSFCLLLEACYSV
jgi:hypothetical protein